MSRSNTAETPFVGPKWWVAAIYLAVALLVQVEVLHFFSFRNAEISVVLAVVVWYAIHVDIRRAAIFGLVAGLSEDLLATQTGGAFTLSTTVTAVLTGMLSSGFFADSIPLIFGIMFVATLVRDALFWGILSREGYPVGFAHLHLHQSLWQALLNALFLVVVTVALRWKEAILSR